jgi:hypothetical protein
MVAGNDLSTYFYGVSTEHKYNSVAMAFANKAEDAYSL